MKQSKRFLSLVLALVMAFGLTAGAWAAGTREEIKAYLNHDITVTYNGEPQALKDAAGNAVYPLSYNDTTYLPVRAVSGILGVEVGWDEASQTVLLSDPAGGRVPAGNSGAASSASGMEEVRAYLNPGITVQYNGKVQVLEDASGNTVYPVSYNDTTYLPIRAVSNMLGVKVDWDGETQTAMLSDPETGSSVPATPDTSTEAPANTTTIFGLNEGLGTVTVSTDDPESNREDLRKAGYSDAEIDKIFHNMNDVFWGAETTKDAKVLGKDHIGNDWFDLDWSSASDSCVKVHVNELPGPSVRVSARVRWDDNGKCRYGTDYTLTEGEWTLPLEGGSTEYAVQVVLSFAACEHYLTEAEKAVWDDANSLLVARFDAEITNPDNRWLLSTPDIDFEHAPLTCAKALEITKNCKTDAEKITAVFNWVAKNIKYDNAMYQEDIRKAQEWEKQQKEEQNNAVEPVADCLEDPINGQHIMPPEEAGPKDLDLDNILNGKTGVCRHYAALMTGMLRSLGVACQYVSGDMYTGKIIEGFSPDGWGGHAWVAVKPATGTLNKSALGAGTDYSDPAVGKQSEPTDWIRLDPTNGLVVPDTTSKDSNYRVESHM